MTCSPDLSRTPYQVATATNEQCHQDKVSPAEGAEVEGCIGVNVYGVVTIRAQEIAAVTSAVVSSGLNY